MSRISERDHQYAFDVHGRWVNAKQTKYEKYQVFFCDCPKKHKMKLVKPSGLSGKRLFCDYFAHVGSANKKQKTEESTSCIAGGESIQHRMAKHRLRELVGYYHFPVFHCKGCLSETVIDSADCTVSIEIVSRDKRWRYDCLLSRGGLPVAALEVVHMHLTSTYKAQSIRESGLEIAEFRVDDVLKMQNDGNKVKLENLKVKIGRCQQCEIKDSYIWIRDCFVDELFELIRQEEAVAENYTLAAQLRIELEIQSKLRRQELMRKSKQWIYDCFSEDLTELKRQESVISNGMIRESELRNALKINDIVEKCIAVLALSLFRLQVDVPLIGVMTFGKCIKCSGGLLVNDFNKRVPTKMMFIYLVRNREATRLVSWRHNSVEPEFHIFLHCSTILRCFSSPCDSLVTLKDCGWPILREIESKHGICASCQNNFRGHTSDNCRYKFCRRCGRKGHLSQNCYAKKDILHQCLE